MSDRGAEDGYWGDRRGGPEQRGWIQENASTGVGQERKAGGVVGKRVEGQGRGN